MEPGDDRTGPACEHVLAVGPSRSGTTFLYRLLTAHRATLKPEWQRGRYLSVERGLNSKEWLFMGLGKAFGTSGVIDRL